MVFRAPHAFQCVTGNCQEVIVAFPEQPIYGGAWGGHCAAHRTKWDTVPILIAEEFTDYPPSIRHEARWRVIEAQQRRAALRETA
jgi:hypothetical protein